jgi:hypothetical protein
MNLVPLPFTCLHGAYTPGVTDGHGNTVPGWADSVPVPCFWWSGNSSEPLGAPTGSDQVSVDITLVVDSALGVDHRDRFTVDGHDFEVVGLPKDYDHGPFNFSPNRRVVELKWMG